MTQAPAEADGPREMPSQVLPMAPFLFGPIAAEAARARPARISLTLMPAIPEDGPHRMPRVDPPVAGWTLHPSGREGPLSLMSFLALWSQAARRIGGVELEMTIQDPDVLAACPFVTAHPSGFPQAIYYDEESKGFSRTILYPLDEEGKEEVV